MVDDLKLDISVDIDEKKLNDKLNKVAEDFNSKVNNNGFGSFIRKISSFFSKTQSVLQKLNNFKINVDDKGLQKLIHDIIDKMDVVVNNIQKFNFFDRDTKNSIVSYQRFESHVNDIINRFSKEFTQDIDKAISNLKDIAEMASVGGAEYADYYNNIIKDLSVKRERIIAKNVEQPAREEALWKSGNLALFFDKMDEASMSWMDKWKKKIGEFGLSKIGSVGGLEELSGTIGKLIGSIGGIISILTTIASLIRSGIKQGERMSGYFQAMLKVFQTSIALIFKPIFDMIGMIFLPVAIFFLKHVAIPIMKGMSKVINFVNGHHLTGGFSIGGILGGIGGTLLGAKLGGMLGTVLGGPVGTIVGALLGAAIELLIKKIWENGDKIKSAIKNFTFDVGRGITSIIRRVVDIGVLIKNKIFGFVKFIFDKLKNVTFDAVKFYMSIYRKMFDIVIHVSESIGNFVGDVVELVSKLKFDVSSFSIDRVVSRAKGYLLQGIGYVLEGFGYFIDSFVKFFAWLGGKVVGIAAKIADYVPGLGSVAKELKSLEKDLSKLSNINLAEEGSALVKRGKEEVSSNVNQRVSQTGIKSVNVQNAAPNNVVNSLPGWNSLVNAISNKSSVSPIVNVKVPVSSSGENKKIVNNNLSVNVNVNGSVWHDDVDRLAREISRYVMDEIIASGGGVW